MLRRLLLLLALVIAGPAAAEPLRVMSFNVRVALASDGPNAWEHRRDLAAAVIRRGRGDVIGTQELTQRQGDDLIARLPGYRWFGRDRRGGHNDEHMGIFYRTDRLTLEEQGDFWLSDTPDVPGSISWGHPLPRMVTWGRFRTRAGRVFTLFNTHFPYRAEDEAARTRAAGVIAARITALPPDMPVVLTGDFNAAPEAPAHAVLTRLLTDVRTAAPTRGPAATFHDFTGRPDRRIDWIMVNGLRIHDSVTITAHAGARYPSDHFPIMARLTID